MSHFMSHFVQTYGVWLVVAVIAVESAGIPVPGETVLVTAAILAGSNQVGNIWSLLAAGIAGAIAGSLVGFWIGGYLGYRVVLRYGSYIGLSDAKLKVGQFLFRRFGVAILIVCRFVPMLRSLVGILAGINRMPTPSFLVGATAGAVAWVVLIGLAAYYLGHELRHQTKAVATFIGLAAAVVVALAIFVIARYEKQLEARAEQELPGPLARP